MARSPGVRVVRSTGEDSSPMSADVENVLTSSKEEMGEDKLSVHPSGAVH